MAFTAKDVKRIKRNDRLRYDGLQKALTETDGDKDKAVEYLREKGLATAEKSQAELLLKVSLRLMLTVIPALW